MSEIRFEDLFAELRALAALRNIVVYNFHFCEAGVGLQWWEPFRTTTPVPDFKYVVDPLERMRQHMDAETRRAKEGSVTYKYYPDIRAMVEAEMYEMQSFHEPSSHYNSRFEKWQAFQAKESKCKTSASSSE